MIASTSIDMNSVSNTRWLALNRYGATIIATTRPQTPRVNYTE